MSGCCGACGCAYGDDGRCGCAPTPVAGYLGLALTTALALVWSAGSLAKAPGYASFGWTRQDWRVVVPDAWGGVRYDERCGGPSNRTHDGHVRLCLPRKVIEELMRTKEGREILYHQAVRKEAARPGQRVAWHPTIRKLHAALEQVTVRDDPRLRGRRR